MKHEELNILLVEYVDGSIHPEQKTIIENALRSSHRLRKELKEIQFALKTLQAQAIPEVPPHYFANFIPRLHERIARNNKKYSFVVPDWVQQIFKPAVAVMVIVIFFTFYQIFKPRIEQRQIHEIVQNAQNEDISEFTHYAAMETDGTEQRVERLSEIVWQNSFGQQLHKIFAKNSTYFESETNELVYATIDPMISGLDDEEINLVIEKINSPTKN